MPYNDDGFYYEEAMHGKDAKRRFYKSAQEMRDRIKKLELLIASRGSGPRREGWEWQRKCLIVALHDHERIGAAYDARYAEAMSDPTGQDLDRFYGDE